MDDLVLKARKLLLEHPHYLADAKAGSRVGNTILGCVLSITTKSPRWATEQAVANALAAMKRRAR